MPARTVFQNSAIVSGLVTLEQLGQAESSLRAALPPPLALTTVIGDEQLAARLVETSILTNYQAEQLRAGRTKLNLGPYIITDWIGQGGMGQVFKAVHKMMGRECAVKVLPTHKATPESIANFTREIRTQAQLDHPHLVRAFDAGHDGKVHYLVTEYVPGTDLRRLVRSRGTLTVQQAAKVILQAALGLAYAHSRGLIHRDVKPGNILVTPEGVAKVSDLGLAGYMDEGDLDPRAGKIVGTADYLSPEQIRTPREVTKASDIYSLGCTLYYAVCGKVPFPGGSTRDKARRHCEETPWHPRRFNPELSRRIRRDHRRHDGEGSGGADPVGRGSRRAAGTLGTRRRPAARPANVQGPLDGAAAARRGRRRRLRRNAQRRRGRIRFARRRQSEPVFAADRFRRDATGNESGPHAAPQEAAAQFQRRGIGDERRRARTRRSLARRTRRRRHLGHRHPDLDAARRSPHVSLAAVARLGQAAAATTRPAISVKRKSRPCAKRQAFVVDPQQVHDGRLKIVHVNRVFHDVVREIVGAPDRRPARIPPPAIHMVKHRGW